MLLTFNLNIQCNWQSYVNWYVPRCWNFICFVIFFWDCIAFFRLWSMYLMIKGKCLSHMLKYLWRKKQKVFIVQLSFVDLPTICDLNDFGIAMFCTHVPIQSYWNKKHLIYLTIWAISYLKFWSIKVPKWQEVFVHRYLFVSVFVTKW